MRERSNHLRENRGVSVFQKIQETGGFLSEHMTDDPDVLLILGSGFSSFLQKFSSQTVLSYREIPHFPESTVEGHPGQLWIGTIKENRVMAMMGRFHYYEGYELAEIAYPVLVAAKEGVTNMVVTNSAGTTRQEYDVGDLMIIKDHINELGASPLRGTHIEELGDRFPDMTYAYTPDLIELAQETAEELGITVREGVYLATHGPEYETPAEIQKYKKCGADAVGMSTVPEVIAANQAGLNVLGISCMTNKASGIADSPLRHEEVIETSENVRGTVERYLEEILRKM